MAFHPMRTTIRKRLNEQFASNRIVRQLHDIPPHEVYEVLVNGRRAVYKGDTEPTGSAGTEGHVTAFVGEQTSIPVPEILLAEDDYYVAAWHPDAPAPDEGQHADETWVYAAGRGLATLHVETADAIDRYGQFRPHDGGVAVAEYDTWHTAALAYVQRHRPILAQHGHTDIADAVIEFLREHPDAFEETDGPVCCHGWATPDHIAVVDGRIACIVDFEHAIAAPGEFDYCRTSMPTFDSETEHLKQTFQEGYESIRSLPSGFDSRKPIYAVLNMIYYFESLYVQNQHGPEKTAERAEWLRNSVTETLSSLS